MKYYQMTHREKDKFNFIANNYGTHIENNKLNICKRAVIIEVTADNIPNIIK
jgi:hypothetical protein